MPKIAASTANCEKTASRRQRKASALPQSLPSVEQVIVAIFSSAKAMWAYAQRTSASQ
ncbi:hypothetical protein NKI51_31305 [Mesorhizobium australicum]|uniref:hypothetical protein n=1 Tax=Mesorhizobium australicum TaxID=536018 RepID=UPI0033361390